MSGNDRWTELEELMLRRSTFGLSPEEMERLEALLAAAPEEDREWIERLIGELDAELAIREEEDLALPAGLRESLLAAAGEAERAIGREGALGPDAYRRRSAGPAEEAPVAPAETPVPEGDPDQVAHVVPIRRRTALEWAGWAAAAAIAVIWLGTSAGPESGPTVEVIPGTDPMERLLAVADVPDAMRIEWTATEDPTARNVSGEIVWSDLVQRGFMRFRGLEANAPDEFQYQLWIFDSERDERFPVDGGVFDIPAGEEEVIVPIDARLPVRGATFFAVTVEAPGGVVVSDRSRVAVVAQGAE